MKRSSILAHRGWWLHPEEKNSWVALTRAIEAGFGIETDFRDMGGRLVVSHDPPSDTVEQIDALRFFAMVSGQNSEGRLALNIKADGLQALLRDTLKEAKCPVDQVFAFDMSVPDGLGYLKTGFPAYSRLSEYEPSSAYEDDTIVGVWVDNFTGAYPQIEQAKAVMERGLRAAIVSPELHGRDHEPLWEEILEAGLNTHPLFEICTDLPEDAAQKFGDSRE